MHHTLNPSPTQHALEALFVHMEDALCWIWRRSVKVQRTLTGLWTGAMRTSENTYSTHSGEWGKKKDRSCTAPALGGRLHAPQPTLLHFLKLGYEVQHLP